MKKYCHLILVILLFFSQRLAAQIVLSHNVGNDLVGTDIIGCTWGDVYWARTFTLQDFGINPEDEFIINSGSVGIYRDSGWDTRIIFNIYAIDSGFPVTFSEANLIGSSQEVEVYSSVNTRIVNVGFNNPVTVPAYTERILVEVHQLPSLNSQAIAFCADTAADNDLSWFRGGNIGCQPTDYTNTIDLNRLRSRFYIVVNGQIIPGGPFVINMADNCSNTIKNFSLTNTSTINSVQWDFGDLSSGADNTSAALNPSHNFSAPGNYTVTTTITNNLGVTDTITRNVRVIAPPVAYAVQDIFACQSTLGSNIATTFNTAGVTHAVLGSQTGKVVTFYDSSGSLLPSPLPNPMSNTEDFGQVITARVANAQDAGCYAETTFNLVVLSVPVANSLSDIYKCDNNNDGFTSFDLSAVEPAVLDSQTGLLVSYYSNGQLLTIPSNHIFTNTVANTQPITVRVTNPLTGCFTETTFAVIVQPFPFANAVSDIIGCDDNSDGISEYFDTSVVSSTIIGVQQDVALTFLDVNGNALTASLANPYTNTTAYTETIIARVTNIHTGCFADTPVTFKTTTQPVINAPQNVYACNEGNGFANFDLTTITRQIIGVQPGLLVSYTDGSGNALPNPLPASFLNTETYRQTIYARVENAANSLCFSETQFDLIINPIPEIDLKPTYYLCDILSSLPVETDAGFDSWEWLYEDGALVSYTNRANLSRAGGYTLNVTKMLNGVSCSDSFSFTLIRSQAPVINEVIYTDLSANNSIEIIAAGNGNLEYSIDGINYFTHNLFTGLNGGIYTAYVKDRDGCGIDWKEVVLLDYPKYFTPNADGNHDFWQITGIGKFPDAEVFIFNRFGQLIYTVLPGERGWDGTNNGNILPATDYWFTTDLKNGKTFKGHFSLIR
jgi:gliding motility-associated-like protein